MSSSSSQPHAAYFEDYNEDAHTTLPETRQTANIAAKRSKPDITKLKPSALTRDETSDSGYSSHTLATLGSGKSSLDSRPGSASLTLDTTMEGLAAGKRRPHGTDRKSQTTQKSPLKSALRRSGSNARPNESLRQSACMCNGCQIGVKAKPQKAVPPLPISSPSEPVTVKQEVKPKVNPPSPPKRAKTPAPTPPRDIPILQPAQPRPRNPASQSYRGARPLSFHGGVMPEPMYYHAPMLLEQGLQVGFSPNSAFPPPSYPPPRNPFFRPLYQNSSQPSHQEYYAIPPSPYDVQPRPQQHSWTSEHYAPPRRPMIYSGTPVVEHPPQLQYSTGPPPSQETNYRSFSQRDRERSVPLRDEYFQVDEDYYRMPPPPVPPKVSHPQHHSRPSIRHAATTNSHPQHYKESGQESPKRETTNENERHRRPSLVPRQSTTTNGDYSEGSHNLHRSFARMNVESNSAAAKQRRRVTYYGGEAPKELERLVEDYQAQKSADKDADSLPLTADSLLLVRKKTQTSNSDAGSRASGEGKASRDGSDVKPRSSTGHRGGSDVKTRNDSEGVTMRFNPAQRVNVDVKGGAEGRTISLRQSRDGGGDMELSIGTKSEAREKSRRRQSYVDGNSVRELEYPRAASRLGRLIRENDDGKIKDRLLAGSRSRRSSKTGRAIND
ncbi:MAG: hypothetical protein Q9190_002028 [Brigantiaea leucoxantha]